MVGLALLDGHSVANLLRLAYYCADAALANAVVVSDSILPETSCDVSSDFLYGMRKRYRDVLNDAPIPPLGLAPT
jgi:hypothetical protein